MEKKYSPKIGHNKKSLLNSPVEPIDIKSFDARKIITKISKYINGTGGGQNFYSTAGGDNISGIDKAISSFNKIISS